MAKVTDEELQQNCRQIGYKKTPGLDEIPNKPLKLAA